MSARSSWFKAVLVLSLVAVITAASGAAHATSATGTQNPDLTVSVSLSSSGSNPDAATVGDTVTVVESVTNNTAKVIAIGATNTLVSPDGTTTTQSRQLSVGAGETATYSYNYTVDGSHATGDYFLTLSAEKARGKSTPSSATAKITIH